MPEIIAVTRDDIRLEFSCPAGANVLEAAEEAGYYLPSVCRHGRCATCWARIVSGAYELAPYITTMAPPSPGSVLLCRCRPREDLVIELPCRDAQIGRREIPARQAVVVEVGRGAPWVSLTLRLKPDALGAAAEFWPGQAMAFCLPEGTVSLAMANTGNDDGLLAFLARPLPGSPLAAWMAAARPGAMVGLRGPLGQKFALDETSPRPRLFIGAGGGLAALLAMLRQLAAERDRTRMQLIFAAAAGELLFLEQSLAGLRGPLPQLAITLVPDEAAAAALLQNHSGPVPDVYASGPDSLLQAVRAAAVAIGVPPARIRTEPAPG